MPEGGVWKTTNARHHVEADLRRRARRRRSAPSRSRRPIRTSSTSAPAISPAGRSRPAKASTSRPTAAGPGRTSGFARSQYIGGIVVDPRNAEHACSSPRSVRGRRGARRGGPAVDGGRARRLSIDRRRPHPGRACCRPTARRARPTSTSITAIRRSSIALLAAAPARRPPRHRRLQVHRRRRDVAAGRRPRPARRRAHLGVRGRVRHARPAAVRGRRRRRRPRRRRQPRRSIDPTTAATRWTLGTRAARERRRQDVRGSAASRRRVPDGHGDLSLDRRRAARRGVLGRAERRRSALPLDRSDQLEADDRRRRSGRRRSRSTAARSWTPYYGLVNGQFYRVATDYDFPYHVCGPQQDSGTACVREPQRLRRDPAERLVSGRRIRERLPDRRSARQALHVHAGLVSRAAPLRSHDRTRSSCSISRRPTSASAARRRSRSRRRIRTLYMAAQHVLASSDRGETWRAISPDLAAPPGVPLAGRRRPAAGGVGAPARRRIDPVARALAGRPPA